MKELNMRKTVEPDDPSHTEDRVHEALRAARHSSARAQACADRARTAIARSEAVIERVRDTPDGPPHHARRS
jgi:hypothetical protein